MGLIITGPGRLHAAFFALQSKVFMLHDNLSFIREKWSKDAFTWAVVVAQLADQVFPTPKMRSSNPDIGNTIFQMELSVNCSPDTIKI